MEWRCDTDNYGAKKTAERMGFMNEGVLRKHMIWRDANRDTAVYSLTNSDWRDGAADHLEALVKQRLEGVKGLRSLRAEEEEGEELAGGLEAEVSAAAVKKTEYGGGVGQGGMCKEIQVKITYTLIFKIKMTERRKNLQ